MTNTLYNILPVHLEMKQLGRKITESLLLPQLVVKQIEFVVSLLIKFLSNKDIGIDNKKRTILGV
jgi:hypothetical protein